MWAHIRESSFEELEPVGGGMGLLTWESFLCVLPLECFSFSSDHVSAEGMCGDPLP